jgi:hypothetical protein
MPMTDLAFCVTVTLTMTQRADQLHLYNPPAHSVALVQKVRSVSPLQPRFGFLRVLAFPKAKIAVEREEIFDFNCHTILKLSERRLTAD